MAYVRPIIWEMVKLGDTLFVRIWRKQVSPFYVVLASLLTLLLY